MQDCYDVLILGAGPSGLCTSNAIRALVATARILVVDCGSELSQRDRNDPSDIVQGVGGAGLWSDGKFSFFPSATHLWSSLERKELMKQSYNATCSLLQPYISEKLPPFPERLASLSEVPTSAVYLKEYASFYANLENRISLIDALSKSATKILCRSRIESVHYDQNNGVFDVQVLTTGEGGFITTKSILAKNLVISTGRFGPESTIIKDLNLQMVFRRLEYGVRIVVDADNSFFQRNDIQKLRDPKIIISSSDVDSMQWRSFCCCRNGEIMETKFDRISTFSGRADSYPTKISNIGFNTRISDAETARAALSDITQLPAAFRISLSGVLSGTESMPYSATASKFMIQGLKSLLESYPELMSADLVGPTLEGVGSYVDHDANLKAKSSNNAPVWVVGDSCGTFRGLVPAMVSGDYVGRIIGNDLICKS